MSREKTVTTGIKGTTALFLVFLVLKLTDVIDWSWWWVTAPLWGTTAIVVGVLLVIFLIFGLGLAFESNERKQKRAQIKELLNKKPKQSKFQERLEKIQKEREQRKYN